MLPTSSQRRSFTRLPLLLILLTALPRAGLAQQLLRANINNNNNNDSDDLRGGGVHKVLGSAEADALLLLPDRNTPAAFSSSSSSATSATSASSSFTSRKEHDANLLKPITGEQHTTRRRALRLPKEVVSEPDKYRCFGFDLRQQPETAVGWVAHPVGGGRIHHMTLFFCPQLGRKGQDSLLYGHTWDCKQDNTVCGGAGDDSLEVGAGYENMMGDAKRAGTPINFPDGAVMSMGKGTQRLFAVIQVHNNAPIEEGDESGFELMVQPPGVGAAAEESSDPPPQFFQVMWDLVSQPRLPPVFERNNIAVPPGDPHFAIEQTWTVPYEHQHGKPYRFKLFAVHMHYHSLGKKITLEVQRGGEVAAAAVGANDDKVPWTVVAQRDGDHGATVFLHPALELQSGDRLRARCEWDSSGRTIATPIGFDAFDNEMADVFLMCYAHHQRGKGVIIPRIV